MKSVKFRLVCWFGLAQFLVCWFVFRDGLFGGSLLAPIDIAPTLFSKYKFVDPASGNIPANHYSIDQLLADLPLQHTMYHAYRRGEIPWWDPYTNAGMPLLADGHSSGTDLPRLIIYELFSFTTAYNWTRIIHFVLLGTGVLLLLLRWGIRPWIAVPLALAYQFAGIYVLEFEHPWVESSFVYYPFLWLAWDGYFREPAWKYIVVGILLTTGIFYAGSIQTHTYLGLFGLGFGLGYCRLDITQWKKILPCLALSAVGGACLAAPILFNQIELFFLSIRKVTARDPLIFLSGVGSLSAIYPWCLGTFRTLDLGKVLGQNSLGFHPFVGSVGALLALAGIFLKTPESKVSPARRAAIFLVIGYLIVLSTPLYYLFYARCAGLIAMGLVVVAAIGAERLLERQERFKRAGIAVLALAVMIAILTNAGALIVYPEFLPKVKKFVAERAPSNPTLDYAPELRDFQVENLANEVSFRNPEALLGWLGLIAVGVLLLRPNWRRPRLTWVCLLVLNVVPVLSFAHRYIPHAKMAFWRRLAEGGAEQQRVISQCSRGPKRLLEVAPGGHEWIFPGAMSHLYAVRSVHGYTSLPPRTFSNLHEDREKYRSLIADCVYESTTRRQREGSLTVNSTPGLARFQWLDQSSRPFTVLDVGLNEIRLQFEPGASGKLLWADTYYPGWRAEANGQRLPIRFAKPCCSEIDIPAGGVEVILRYRPRFLGPGIVAALIGLIILGICGTKALRSRGRNT